VSVGRRSGSSADRPGEDAADAHCAAMIRARLRSSAPTFPKESASAIEVNDPLSQV
jgi:hypothetical protein